MSIRFGTRISKLITSEGSSIGLASRHIVSIVYDLTILMRVKGRQQRFQVLEQSHLHGMKMIANSMKILLTLINGFYLNLLLLVIALTAKLSLQRCQDFAHQIRDCDSER